LIVCLLRDCGIPVPDGDGKTYGPDWYVHTPEERYLSGLLVHGIPVEQGAMQIGDVPYFRTGLISPSRSEVITHGGVWLGEGRFIHSITGRLVEITEIRFRAWAKTYAGSIRLKTVMEALGETVP
jgi:cell wall-associated NlpC family hydrolase